jgi:hypothetical protein
MVILFLLAQLALPPHTQPKWIETPVPHWHCDAGMVYSFEAKVCRPFSPADRRDGYDAQSHELVRWGWVKIVPANGTLRIEFPPELTGQPGCEVIDKSDSENTMRFSAIRKDGFTIQAKPGHKLHLNCRGILPRASESAPAESGDSQSSARTATRSPAWRTARQSPIRAETTAAPF